VVSTLSWIGWLAARDMRQVRATGVAIVLLGASGGILAASAPAAIAFVGVAGIGAALAYELPVAVALAAIGPVANLISAAVQHSTYVTVAGSTATALGGLVIGVARRQAEERATQQAMVTVERERAELLAERNRLGREIHDVLAHTLGAVSVQIEALDAVIDTDSSAQLHDRVQATRRLVTQGLSEVRRAVSALRDDTPPLAQQLKEVCETSGAELVVTGTPRTLTAHVALALLRIAQEGLTNAAKHAPGGRATVTLAFTPGAATLSVDNEVGHGGVHPHAGSGGGFGLQGMRERVLLLGGELEAGPAGPGWSVQATLPA
jgi:signal transduction histidine kinase